MYVFAAHNVLPFWLKCSEKYNAIAWAFLYIIKEHTLRIKRRKAVGYLYLRDVILLKPQDRKDIIFTLEHLDSNLKD